MRRMRKLLGLMAMLVTLLLVSTASAFAAEADFEGNTVQATGFGVAPANVRNAAQARMLARRAAVVDAYRQLAETIKGVNVDAETTVEMAAVTSDTIKTKVSALVQGAQVVSEQATPDGGYEVTMKVSMFGVSDSVAAAVLPQDTVKESFPQPTADVAPSLPAYDATATISMRVSIQTGEAAPTPTSPAMSHQGSSAAAAPAGKAIGGYTGLIVDCRNLGLKPVMSPVIKNENGQPIYGYKNLESSTVIANGMAGYTSDINRATRAGSNPLVVRAVSLDNHNGNPVLSMADANRVLIENGATGFLDRTNVVFLR